jgi:hypothetical protein
MRARLLPYSHAELCEWSRMMIAQLGNLFATSVLLATAACSFSSSGAPSPAVGGTLRALLSCGTLIMSALLLKVSVRSSHCPL